MTDTNAVRENTKNERSYSYWEETALQLCDELDALRAKLQRAEPVLQAARRYAGGCEADDWTQPIVDAIRAYDAQEPQ